MLRSATLNGELDAYANRTIQNTEKAGKTPFYLFVALVAEWQQQYRNLYIYLIYNTILHGTISEALRAFKTAGDFLCGLLEKGGSGRGRLFSL